jgi:hypothetical protein
MTPEFTITVEQDDTPVRGNAMCSGDDEADRKVEDSILARLDLYDVWAWAFVTVWATVEKDGETFKGRASLGGCCYRDEAEFRSDAYFADLCDEARDDLLSTLAAATIRGNIAAQVCP